MVLITSATTPFGLLVGAAVQVLPLLLAAGLMKLSGSALGGISNVLNSLGNNLSGRATKALSPIQEANRQKAIENAMKRQRSLNLLPWYWGGALAAGIGRRKFLQDDENRTRENTINNYRNEELEAKGRGARILYRDKYGKAVYAERSLGVDKDGIEKKTQLVDPNNKVMRYKYQNRVSKLATDTQHTKTEDALGNMGDYLADNKVRNKDLETLASNQTENFLEYKTAESSKRRNDHNANRFYSEVVRNAAKIDKNGNIVNKEDYEKYVVAGAGTDAWKVNDGTLSKEQESDRFIALQMVAADAVDAYESERRANVGKLSTYMDKMVTLDAFNLYKQMFKHKNIDGIIAGNNVLSRRGDYDKILKTVRTYMDDGNLKLGTDAANALALNLMQMKDDDPTLGRIGKFINMETWTYTSGKRQTQEVTIEQFFTGKIEDKFLTHISDQQQKDKEKGYSTKINMATGLEGTSFAKVDRTAFDNVQDMINYYDDTDPDMGQKIRKSILPAIISAMPTYQSGSEQRRNATKLVTGLDNDNYHNGKTIEENVPNVKKSQVAYDFSRDYLKSLTGADAAKLTTDMLDGLETRLMAQHYDFNPDNYSESERAAAQKEALAKAKQEAHAEINKIFTENTVIETLANKSGRLFDGMKSRLKDIVRPAVEEYRKTHASQTKNSGKNKN